MLKILKYIIILGLIGALLYGLYNFVVNWLPKFLWKVI